MCPKYSSADKGVELKMDNDSMRTEPAKETSGNCCEPRVEEATSGHGDPVKTPPQGEPKTESHTPTAVSSAPAKGAVGSQQPQKNKPTLPFPTLEIEPAVEPYDPEFTLPRAPRTKAMLAVLATVLAALALGTLGEYFVRSTFLPSERPAVNVTRSSANR